MVILYVFFTPSTLGWYKPCKSPTKHSRISVYCPTHGPYLCYYWLGLTVEHKDEDKNGCIFFPNFDRLLSLYGNFLVDWK